MGKYLPMCEAILKSARELLAYLLMLLIGVAASGAKERQSVAPLKLSSRDAVEQKDVVARSAGGRLILISNFSLSDYAAYRRDERFYVVIPRARLTNASVVSALPGASVENRGSDLILSFPLRPNSGAHVNQRFNRLEIIFTGSESTAVNPRAHFAPDSDRSALKREEKRSEIERRRSNDAPNLAEVAVSPPENTRAGAPEEARSEAKVESQPRPAFIDGGWLVAAFIALLIVLFGALSLSKRRKRWGEGKSKLEQLKGEELGAFPSRAVEANFAHGANGSIGHREVALPAASEDQAHESQPEVDAQAGVGDEWKVKGVADGVRNEDEYEEEGLWRSIIVAFDDPIRERRAEAARALVQIAERSAKSRAEIFARALLGADAGRRRRIGEAIYSSGLADEAISRLADEDDEARDAFALLFVMAKAGEFEPLARAIQESESNRIRLAVVRLLALCDHPAVLPMLKRLAAQTELPSDVRSALMEAVYQQSSARLLAES